MKFKVAISIEGGPLPHVVHVAVPYNGKFMVCSFRFKYPHLAQELMIEYLQTYLSTPKGIAKFHFRKLREDDELFKN